MQNNREHMKARDHILSHTGEFLTYLKGRVPVFHFSNVFFRDIHYAVIALAAEHGMRAGYTEAEDIARHLIERLEKEKVLVPIDRQTWSVRKDDLRTPSVKPAVPAKPAASAAQPAAPAAQPA
jgi:hypothetical protein